MNFSPETGNGIIPSGRDLSRPERGATGEQGVMNHAPTGAARSVVKIHQDALRGERGESRA